ncbi:uncharacterized protein [Procambarus clarkii]|uniref:uncharacterized protein n=1 Tax=Procambarus clarkii TaxID=6728 RepID=UPI0037448782
MLWKGKYEKKPGIPTSRYFALSEESECISNRSICRLSSAMATSKVAWVTALLCGLAAGVCEPDCSIAVPPDLVMVADPVNCTRFYVCAADGTPSDSPASCPAGTYFDGTASTPDCTGELPCDPTCELPKCLTTCAADLDKIFDQTSCSRYYICMGGSLLGPIECPVDQPYFDGVGSTCSTDEAVCCGDPCIAYCYEPGSQVPDPYDCTKYYLCTKVGLVNEQYVVNCPSGSNYDANLGHCVVGGPCNIMCNDTTVPGGSTTLPPVCQESMTCTAVGRFPMCTTCYQQYFNCRTVGQPATVETCTGSLLFNTDPSYPYCVKPDDCPRPAI